MVDPCEIEGLVFNTHDNDGEWHTASLNIAGEMVTFAQGSVHGDVHGRFQRMLEELKPFRADLPTEETRT